MKRSPPASERARYAAEVRKPGPVKHLSREETAKLEHERNWKRFQEKLAQKYPKSLW